MTHRVDVGALTRAGLSSAKARGVKLGNRTNLAEAQAKGAATNRATFDAFAATAGVRGVQYPIVAGTGTTSGTTAPTVGGTLGIPTASTVGKGIYAVLN